MAVEGKGQTVKIENGTSNRGLFYSPSSKLSSILSHITSGRM
jgi:hypothetical protein